MTRNNYPSADEIVHHANGHDAKVAVINQDGTIVSVNKVWQSSAISQGYDVPGYGVGTNYLTLCDRVYGRDADYARQASKALRSVLACRSSTETFEYVCASADHEKWAMFIASPLPPPWPRGASVMHVDIGPTKNVEQAFRRSEERLRQHLDALPILVAYVDSNLRYRFNNQAYEAWFSIGELRGRKISDVLGESISEEIRPYIERCFSGEAVQFEKSLRFKEGRQVHVRCDYVPDMNQSGQVRGMFAFIQDITKERSLAVRIEHQSMHDALTGLPNRVLFQSHLDQLIEANRGQDSFASLMILDLDDFKDVNDTLGHAFGDSLLRAVARRLEKLVPENGVLARLGGDEFAVLQSLPATEHGAQMLAEQIIGAVEAPFLIAGHEVHISTSIGIAWLREDVVNTGLLMKRADLALYRAKSEGRGRYQVFVDQMWTNLMRRQRLLRGLRHALDTSQLTLHFQPQVDLETGTMVAVEALARWQHPKFGNIEPKTFIPIAESSGLIGALGDCVLRQACAQAAAWRRAGNDHRVAVNISPTQVKQPGFLDQIQEVISEAKVQPDWLEFEITEAVLVDTDRRDHRILEQIADLGIHLAIDDFGSGYSSLVYLKKLPVHKVKIDQCFVRDIGINSDDEAIVKAIITLGHQLGKRVTAEGVESEAQAAFLAENGCDEAQGFYFARPRTIEAIEEWLSERAGSVAPMMGQA